MVKFNSHDPNSSIYAKSLCVLKTLALFKVKGWNGNLRIKTKTEWEKLMEIYKECLEKWANVKDFT